MQRHQRTECARLQDRIDQAVEDFDQRGKRAVAEINRRLHEGPIEESTEPPTVIDPAN